MKIINSIDEFIDLIDIERWRNEIESCLEYVSNTQIQCVTIDEVDEGGGTAINLYNSSQIPCRAENEGGTWFNYSVWYTVGLIRVGGMSGTYKLEDKDEIDLFFDKLRMMVL